MICTILKYKFNVFVKLLKKVLLQRNITVINVRNNSVK